MTIPFLPFPLAHIFLWIINPFTSFLQWLVLTCCELSSYRPHQFHFLNYYCLCNNCFHYFYSCKYYSNFGISSTSIASASLPCFLPASYPKCLSNRYTDFSCGLTIILVAINKTADFITLKDTHFSSQTFALLKSHS